MNGRPSHYVDDVAPDSATLTDYDERHMAIYLLLLDAEAEGDSWQDVANVVLNIDPITEPRRVSVVRTFGSVCGVA